MASREPIVLPELGDRILVGNSVWIVVSRCCDQGIECVDVERRPQRSDVMLTLVRVGSLPKQEARCNSRSG